MIVSNHTVAVEHCAKTNIKGTMRSVLGERIVALCKSMGRDLKDKIALPALFPLAPSLVVDYSQSGLRNFTTGDGSKRTTPEQKNAEDVVGSGDPDRIEDEELPDSSDEPCGLIYARVSSGNQLKSAEDDKNGDFDEGSIRGQIDELTELASKEEIHLPLDPISDEAKTGTNFDRDGIQEVFEVCKRKDIDYLLVEKVDRVGRSAPETLYFIYILQAECDVTLLTPSGERDINQVEGLMQTTLLSLMAEVQNDIRTTKAKKERIRGFLHKKNWKCKSPKIPLGYNETDDGWLRVDSTEKKIVRDMFQKFVNCGVYAETERYIDEKYGSDVLDGHQVDTLLKNAVYIGRPRLPEEWVTETTYKNDLEDESLHLLEQNHSADIDVNESIFMEAQDMIDDIEKRNSIDEDTHQLLDFIEDFSLFAVIEGSEAATLLHHCGEPLVTDGQRDLNGRTVHRYRCRKCEESENQESYYRQWPRQYALDQIKLIQDVVDDDSDPFEDF